MLYIARLWGKIGEFSVRTADIASLVLPPIVAFVCWAFGLELPKELSDAIIILIGGGLFIAFAMRLVVAPYLVWRDDQSSIAHLQQVIDAPSRERHAALLAHFDASRAELIKRLMTLLGDLREMNAAFENADSRARELYALAAPFLIDKDFKIYWFTFEKSMKSSASCRRWAIEAAGGGELPKVDQARVLLRYSFHYAAIQASVTAMAELLANNPKHREGFDTAWAQISSTYASVDFSFGMPPMDNFHEVNWHKLSNPTSADTMEKLEDAAD